MQRAFGLMNRTICRLDVSSLEHVPRSGPCLLIFNHLSNFDIPLIGGALPRADVVALVAASYRANPFFRVWVDGHGSAWLRRGEGDRATLRTALKAFQDGRMVAMAPEGGRSPDHAMRQAKPGAAALAIRSAAPILPLGLWGTELLHRSLRRLQRPVVSVRFGPPFYAPPAGPGSRQAHREEVTQLMMDSIADLIPPAYRGQYGGSRHGSPASISGTS